MPDNTKRKSSNRIRFETRQCPKTIVVNLSNCIIKLAYRISTADALRNRCRAHEQLQGAFED